MTSLCKGCEKDVTDTMYCECGGFPLGESSTFEPNEYLCDRCGDTGKIVAWESMAQVAEDCPDCGGYSFYERLETE